MNSQTTVRPQRRCPGCGYPLRALFPIPLVMVGGLMWSKAAAIPARWHGWCWVTRCAPGVHAAPWVN